MGVKDKKMSPDDYAALKCVRLAVASVGNSQSDVNFATATVPFAFEVVAVFAWARSVTATVTVDVKAGTTSVLAAAITPTQTTAAPAAGTLATTRSTRRGAANTTLRLHVTTNGSGALADAGVTVWVRPYPLNNEA